MAALPANEGALRPTVTMAKCSQRLEAARIYLRPLLRFFQYNRFLQLMLLVLSVNHTSLWCDLRFHAESHTSTLMSAVRRNFTRVVPGDAD